MKWVFFIFGVIILGALLSPVAILGSWVGDIAKEERDGLRTDAANFDQMVIRLIKTCTSEGKPIEEKQPLTKRTCECLVKNSVNHTPLPSDKDLSAYILDNFNNKNLPTHFPKHLLLDYFYKGDFENKTRKAVRKGLTDEGVEFLRSLDSSEANQLDGPAEIKKVGFSRCARDNFNKKISYENYSPAQLSTISRMNERISRVKDMR